MPLTLARTRPAVLRARQGNPVGKTPRVPAYAPAAPPEPNNDPTEVLDDAIARYSEPHRSRRERGMKKQPAPIPGVPQLSVRRETRYVLADVSDLRDLLSARADPNTYGVTTQYLDTADGTWSKDPCQPRIRLRTYGDGTAFIEVKLSAGSRTYAKSRQSVSSKPDGLVVLATSNYTRTEYQVDDLRVTIDAGLTDGTRTFDGGFIVETKQQPGQKLPGWLKAALPAPSDFSKWNFVSSS